MPLHGCSNKKYTNRHAAQVMPLAYTEKYKDHMSLLYKAYETFKDELTSVLNHPLMSSEFERAWHDLMGKYDLQNDEIMKALWTDREEWISAYYKEVFCARMTSTQRSESMYQILKRNF